LLRNIVLRGRTGAIVWAYRTVVPLGPWVVRRWRDDERQPYRWALEASLPPGAVPDAFGLRQRPLLFTAPQWRAGHFCFPVRGAVATGAGKLVVDLDPPER
jgi:hypothetical protein